jgi:hypothetical protein
MFAIDEPEPAWVPLPILEQFQRHGKRDDDLIVDGDRLIAVDDIVVPQYLLLYDVSSPLKPALAEVKELPWHTTYEHIERGALGPSYLALLSSGVNHGTCTSHIAFYERAGLGSLGSFSAIKQSYRTGLGQDTRSWHDLAWYGDVLLIAAEEDGVGLLDLDTISRPPLLTFDEQRHSWRGGEGSQRFSEECARKLRYLPVPDGKCLRLYSVPDTRHVLALVQTADRANTVVLDVDALLASATTSGGG